VRAFADADAAFVVALRQSPGGWLDDRPADLPPTRFVATYPHPDCVRTVSDPGDLTGIAIAVSEFLDAPRRRPRQPSAWTRSPRSCSTLGRRASTAS